ncbi:MAG: pilus assembly protein TadG-related protein, partial [Hyphomicrobiaceae bacterium]
MKRLTARTRSFRTDENGSIAILFALTTFMVVSLVGGAVDFGRALTVRSQMQNALDASVLAGARVWQTEKNLVLAEQKALQYFNNNKPTGLDSSSTTFTSDVARNAIVMEASGSMYAPFLSAAWSIGGTMTGAPSSSFINTVNARAEALLAVGGSGETNLEIAMMLDITGSMSGDKIVDLKAAAKDLIDIVVWDDQSEYTSKVALVPFADAVNLGSAALADSVRGTAKATYCRTSGSACTGFTTGSPSNSQWTPGIPAKYYYFQRPDGSYNTWQLSSYCVTERIGANKYSDVAPDSAANKVMPLYGSSSAS